MASGFLVALGGIDGRHTNRAGKFVNSLRLWIVERFVAFLVVHLSVGETTVYGALGSRSGPSPL